METLRGKLIESGEKLQAYANGMEKLAHYSDNLREEILNLNAVLERAKKENNLRKISKDLEDIVEKLKSLKGNFALFSDERSLVRGRIEKITRMTKIIRGIDTSIVKLSKSFANINARDIDLFLQNSGRFINSAKNMKDELINYGEKIEKETNAKKEIIKKLAKLEKLRQQNEKLEEEIKDKFLKMDGEKFMKFKEKFIKGNL